MDKISETKTPTPGEWWLRNSGGRIFFIVGFDPWGCVVHWNENVGFFTSKMRFFCREFRYEPRCTGFGWVEPPAIDPGEGWELLPVGTMLERYDQVSASGMTGPSWMDTLYMFERIGSRPGLEGPYRRKIKPVESPTACVACGVNWALDGSVSCRECYEHAIEATKCPVESPDDWVTQDRVPVRVGDECWWGNSKYSEQQRWWAAKAESHTIGKMHGVKHLTTHLTLEVRCRRRDLPVAVPATKRVPVRLWINEEDGVLFANPDQVLASDEEILHDADGFFVESPAENPDDMPLNRVPGKVVATGTVTLTPVESPDIAAIIAEHTQQVRELTQRIGELAQQVNERDALIEKIRAALHEGYFV